MSRLSGIRSKRGGEDRRAKRSSERRKKARAKRRSGRKVVFAKSIAVAVLIAACIALALVVGNADYQATAVGWMPLITVLICLALARAYLALLKGALEFHDVSLLEDCYRDRDIRFTVSFRNKAPLFFFRIEAYFFISDLYGNTATEAMTTLSLSPFEEYDLGFNARFDHIGTYTAGLDRVRIVDFLNLFSAVIPNPNRQSVNVMPRILQLDGVQFSQDALVESVKASKTVQADSVDYAYVRDYVPGDPLKAIHWKLSAARSQGYYTRLYEMPINPSVGVVLDFYGPSNESAILMRFFDTVVESGLSLAEYARASGMDASVLYRDREGSEACLTSWDEGSLSEVIASMPPMSCDEADSVAALDIVRNQLFLNDGASNIIICTANVSAAMASIILEAKTRQRSAYLVAVIPSDLVGKEREDYAANLVRLDSSGANYCIISSVDELMGAMA